MIRQAVFSLHIQSYRYSTLAYIARTYSCAGMDSLSINTSVAWMRTAYNFLPAPHVSMYIFNCRQLYRSDKVDLTVSTSEIETESEAWLVFNDPFKWVLQSYGRYLYSFRVLIVWIGAAHIPIELALLPWDQHEIEASVGRASESKSRGFSNFIKEGHGFNSAFTCYHYDNLTQSCSPCILLQVVVFS